MAARPRPGRKSPPMRGASPPRGPLPGRGRGSPGRGRGALPPPPIASIPVPPPPPPPPPPPASPTDEQKKILQNMLAKKVAEWDKMMNTQKHDERTKSFEEFRKISEEEVALAARMVSKDRPTENRDKMMQGTMQGMMPGIVQGTAQGMAPESMPGMVQGTVPKEMPGIIQGTAVGMMPEMLPGEIQGMVPGMTPGMVPQMAPQMLPSVAQRAPFRGGQMSPMQALSVTFGGQVRAPITMADTEAVQMARRCVPVRDLRRPSMTTMPYTFKCKAADLAAKNIETRSSSPGLEIDGKLKLLSQLESARRVLRNRPPGSTSSMADEIKRRMRKIHRLQIQVIDEIMGEKDYLMTDMSDLHPQVDDLDAGIIREEAGRARKKQDDQREARKAKTAKERKTVVVLPEPASTKSLVIETIIRSTSTPDNNGSDSYPDGENKEADYRPEVLWERPQLSPRYAEKASLEIEPLEDICRRDECAAVRNLPRDRPYRPPRYEPRYETSYNRPYEPNYEPHYHLEDYPREQTHYHDDPRLSAFNPSAACPALTYSVIHSSHCQLPLMPLNMEMAGAQESMGMVNEVHNVGVEVSSLFLEDRPEKKPSLSTSKTGTELQKLLSKSTLIIQMKGNDNSVAPAAWQVMPAPPPTPNPTTQFMSQLSQTTQLLGPHIGQPPESRDRSNDYDDALNNITSSVKEIVRSLSTLSDQQARASSLRRDQSDDSDDYVDDDGYDNDDYDDYRLPTRREKNAPFSRERRRRQRDQDAEAVSLWGWLCRGGRDSTEMTPPRSGRARAPSQESKIAQVGSRIRNLIQKVIRVSNEVVEARKVIQQSGMQGPESMQHIFSAENKLRQLIDLEEQLVHELAQYRQYSNGSDAEYFASLAEAEGKIRRLIDVKTQLANEIGAWRSMTQATSQNVNTAFYRVPGRAGFTSSAASPAIALSPSSSSTGYTS
ncbi:unnamed protein product [Ixodes pacificus]